MDSFDRVPRLFDGLWLPLEIAMRPWRWNLQGPRRIPSALELRAQALGK
jgi:hypothetical protein